MNCRDCDLLIISRKKRLIWCAENLLPSCDGKQKFIHLYEDEVDHIKIRDRKIFHYANECILANDNILEPGFPL
jgi:hypothetical protein